MLGHNRGLLLRYPLSLNKLILPLRGIYTHVDANNLHIVPGCLPRLHCNPRNRRRRSWCPCEAPHGGACLFKHKILWTDKLPKKVSPHAVHSAGLEIHEDCAGHITSTGSLVIMHIDALQPQVGITMICSGGVDAVLVKDQHSEFCSNLFPH